jgi:hypothetical protein
MIRSGKCATQREELSTLDDWHSKFERRRFLRTGFCLLVAVILCSPAAWGKKHAAKHAQAKPPAQAPAKKGVPNPWLVPSASKLDVSAGFAYWKPSGTLSNGNKFQPINAGFTFGGAYYFSKHFGVNADVGIHPETSNDGAATFAGGIIYRVPLAHFTPFVHVLGGMADITGANVPTIGTSSFFYNHAAYGSLAMAGGGLDYEPAWKGHALGIRLFEADYENIQKDFGAYGPTSGGDAKLNVVRLSAGLVAHFGNRTSEPKVDYTCDANPGIVYPGDLIHVVGTLVNPEPNKTPTYAWAVTGGKIVGKANTATIDTTHLAGGTYEIRGRVRQGPKPNETAVCRSSFIVRQYPAPTLTCSVDNERVIAGQVLTIHSEAKVDSPYKLSYSYKTTKGTLTANGDTATVQTSGADVGIVQVTCIVTDEAGQAASALAVAAVEPPLPPPAPKTQRLCSLNFMRDQKRPTRVDNEAKACLDDIALTMQHFSSAKLVIVGESAACEQKGEIAAVQRAVNAADYLIHQQGIDPARIEYRLGQAGLMQVDDYLLPPGANFNQDVPGTLLVDQSHIKPEPRIPLRVRHVKQPAKKQPPRK